MKWCRYHLEKKPHIIADSAFGSLSLLKDIERWGGHATLSFSILKESWLWNSLCHAVPINHWRAAVLNPTPSDQETNRNQWIAAVSVIENRSHKFVAKKIVTNAFSADVHGVNCESSED